MFDFSTNRKVKYLTLPFGSFSLFLCLYKTLLHGEEAKRRKSIVFLSAETFSKMVPCSAGARMFFSNASGRRAENPSRTALCLVRWLSVGLGQGRLLLKFLLFFPFLWLFYKRNSYGGKKERNKILLQNKKREHAVMQSWDSCSKTFWRSSSSRPLWNAVGTTSMNLQRVLVQQGFSLPIEKN